MRFRTERWCDRSRHLDARRLGRAGRPDRHAGRRRRSDGRGAGRRGSGTGGQVFVARRFTYRPNRDRAPRRRRDRRPRALGPGFGRRPAPRSTAAGSLLRRVRVRERADGAVQSGVRSELDGRRTRVARDCGHERPADRIRRRSAGTTGRRRSGRRRPRNDGRRDRGRLTSARGRTSRWPWASSGGSRAVDVRRLRTPPCRTSSRPPRRRKRA